MALMPASSGSLDEPIEGWRVWNLSDGEGGPLLHPAGSGVDVWRPRAAVEARCGASPLTSLGIGQPHEAPDFGCTCGIHAARSLAGLDRPRPAWPPPPVVGTVSLWGTVVEHERGWRARYAYPSRLGLVCAMCAWFEPGPGTPEVVHAFAGRVYTLCALHRGGIELPGGRRTSPTGRDPLALRSRLLDAYAVDPLPAAAVRSLIELPATVAPPAYVPSIRVVPVEDEGRPAGRRPRGGVARG
jgi:hypothetical protein